MPNCTLVGDHRPMGYRLGADAVIVVHLGYLVYLVVGGFLAWRWPRTLWLHLAAAAWGLVIVLFPLVCPLTWLEDTLRERAGEARLRDGFIDTYLAGVVYPERYETALRIAVAVLVVTAWIGVYVRRRADRNKARHGAGTDRAVPG